MPTAKRQRQKAGRQAQQQARQAALRRRQVRNNILSVLVVGAVLIGLYTVLFGDDSDSSSSTTTVAAAGCPKADGTSPTKIDFQIEAQPQCISADKAYTAKFTTSEGNFEAELDNTEMPTTVNNFVVLARHHYYDGNQIFRLADSIDIWQTGSPHTQDNTDQGPGYTLDDEQDRFTYTSGDLAMARSQVASGGQFFVGYGPEISNLDGQGPYLKFGKITEGLEVAQAIGALRADDGTNSYDGPPNKTVTIQTVTISETNRAGADTATDEDDNDSSSWYFLGAGAIAIALLIVFFVLIKRRFRR